MRAGVKTSSPVERTNRRRMGSEFLVECIHVRDDASGGDCGSLRLRSGGVAIAISRTTVPRAITPVDALVRALRLSFDKRTGAGYFLRAESLFNTVIFRCRSRL